MALAWRKGSLLSPAFLLKSSSELTTEIVLLWRFSEAMSHSIATATPRPSIELTEYA